MFPDYLSLLNLYNERNPQMNWGTNLFRNSYSPWDNRTVQDEGLFGPSSHMGQYFSNMGLGSAISPQMYNSQIRLQDLADPQSLASSMRETPGKYYTGQWSKSTDFFGGSNIGSTPDQRGFMNTSTSQSGARSPYGPSFGGGGSYLLGGIAGGVGNPAPGSPIDKPYLI